MQAIIRGLVLASLSVTTLTAAAWGTPESRDYGYEGEVNADGQPHGQGVMSWSSQWHSRRIEGEFRDGKAHGQGEYTGGYPGITTRASGAMAISTVRAKGGCRPGRSTRASFARASSTVRVS